MAEEETVISSNQSNQEPTQDKENPTPKEEDNSPEARRAKLETQMSIEDRQKLGDEIEKKYTGWREPRRTYELQWFINAAYIDGKHTSESIQSLATIQDISKVDRRKKNIANKLFAKYRARFAKFAKTRPKGIVVPFTAERESRLDARATERALDYQYEKADQEQKYLDVVQWAARTGKAYWALNWDDKKTATLREKDKLTGKFSYTDFEAGDVSMEVCSGFDILVPEVRQFHLGKQSEVMHVQVKETKELQDTYPEFAEFIKSDSKMVSPFEFERQISYISGSEAGAMASMGSDMKGPQSATIVKTLYKRPNYKYPKGRMVVVMNGFAVKVQDELPFGFSDMENPYPFVEFADMPSVGRFYCGTFVEQLIPLQRGYNMLRDKIESQMRLNIHPKVIVPKQARIPKGSFTNEAAEVIEWQYIPGMPEPHAMQPGNIAPDAWRFAQMLAKEFDDISQVQPVIEGKAGSAKSGLQTSLLQEASDNVHSPDARGFELSIRDASYKLRRMMKFGYTVPRVMSFSGRSAIPEVFEFSQKNIDEHATIVIQIGSALSKFKATQIQQFLELYKEGLLGDAQNPELKRRVLGLMDVGGLEQFQEEARQDEDMARMENIDMVDGKPMPIPMFYEDHIAHYETHTDELKNPANRGMPDSIRRILIAHTLLHLKWFNPVAAFNLAMELGFKELLEKGLIKQPPVPAPGQQPPQPPSQGGPKPGAPAPRPAGQ